jgi:fructose-1,6-bisphosphatase/inositol monophosphatase family enzyme
MSPSTGRTGVDVPAVTALVEQVAYHLVLPRFRDLAEGEVTAKAPGDLVTVVDLAAEDAIVAGLRDLAPGIPVVGEEGVAADPSRLDALHAPAAFLVDPIDGTRAFVEGAPDYAVMVALVSGGDAVAGWICLPSREQTWVAEQGSGATRNGEAVARAAVDDPARVLLSPTRHLDAEAAVRAAGDAVDLSVRGPLWCGRHYTALAGGELDALGYWSGWPWDHAPGSVLVRELGGAVLAADGSDYRPTGRQTAPIVAGADRRTADLLRSARGVRGRAAG